MNVNPKVEDYLDTKVHPLIPEIQRVREIVLTADPKVEEGIKWSSPTFMYKGNIASFMMNAKKMVSLMFHKGALINDTTGLLEGDGAEGRVARFKDMDDIEAKREKLQQVIRAWVELQDA